MTTSDYISITAAIIAGGAAIFTYIQASYTRKAVEQQNHIRLFEAFEENSTRLFNHPTLLVDVHGYPLNEYSDHEGRAIAYLCSFLDAFQVYYERKFSGDFSKMKQELIDNSSYFSKSLLHPPNQERFFIIKALFYGDFDKNYINAIDQTIAHYNAYHRGGRTTTAHNP